jgi:pantoate--beta-alanine ligase
VNLARTPDELQDELAEARAGGLTVGFVPTMGALHDGHISLIRAARQASDVVVVSIFVNPLQFGPGEDFATYPRDEDADLRRLESAGVDVAFLPGVDDMYPPGRSTSIEVGELGGILEGASRPGHFAGVATVVTKLLNIVGPRVAFFGQKDAQQLAVVRRVAADLSIPVEIRSCPTVRDADGLALSSRNVRLDAGERTRATALYDALRSGQRVLTEEHSVPAAEKTMLDVMRSANVEPDYAAVVDPDSFRPYPGEGRALLLVAARVGQTRLIDNLLVDDTSNPMEG